MMCLFFAYGELKITHNISYSDMICEKNTCEKNRRKQRIVRLKNTVSPFGFKSENIFVKIPEYSCLEPLMHNCYD